MDYVEDGEKDRPVDLLDKHRDDGDEDDVAGLVPIFEDEEGD